jgi:[acyl-carrier-protein] S-malonyltransferase
MLGPAGFRVKSSVRFIAIFLGIWNAVGTRPPLDSTAPGGVLRRNFRVSAKRFAGASMTAAFTFPGQGSQAIGMGKALADAFPAARAVFDEVDDALGEKLTAIIWDGPAETLQLTENAQPALMAVSLATLRVLETEVGFSVARDAAFVAGHSLGEYSALAAAGSLSIRDSARLLRTRGRAMQKGVPVGVGAMAALLGLEYEAAVAIAEEAAQGQVCQAANDNGGGQVVVSGDKAAVERALEIAKTRGAKRAMLLPVSAPFHCRLMQPAAEVMAKALAEVTINKPVVPPGNERRPASQIEHHVSSRSGRPRGGERVFRGSQIIRPADRNTNCAVGNALDQSA